jgi:hypothetical protein
LPEVETPHPALHECNVPLDAAARALGVSRRMVAYYEQGTKPIPRVVALATRGLEHV